MCGIAGLLGPAGGPDLRETASRMARALAHRGPDAEGVWSDAEAGVALGHRRLAIVELTELGVQPMVSSCGRFMVTYNGEIYNQANLRAELEAAGAAPQWRGGSDTETLLAGFSAWGVAETLHRAKGMFALALWDRKERRLTLARDRFGEKPLYYGWIGEGRSTFLAFGSELKALRAVPGFANPIDRDSLALFMRFCNVPGTSTIYRDIHKLAPGSTLTLSEADLARRSLAAVPYWTFLGTATAALADPVVDEAEGLAELERRLETAIGRQLMSDVPLGAFLSGGVDSSTVVALMQRQSAGRVKTFTIGFEDAAFDEAPHAAAVARHLGTEHHETRFTAAETRDLIPSLPTVYDEPFADSSQLPTMLVSAVARQHVAVALSGDAGDEVFGGYSRYVEGPRIWRYGRMMTGPGRRLAARAIRAASPDAWDRIGAMPGLRDRVGRLGDKAHKLAESFGRIGSIDDLYREMVVKWTGESGPVLGAGARPTSLDDASWRAGVVSPEHRMMIHDTFGYLVDDVLVKVDRAAMSVSLETRAPFLDPDVVEWAWRLPVSMKIRGRQSKWALRQILYRHVPRELVERPKAGFAVPVGNWLRGPLRDWAEDLIAERRLRDEGWLDVEHVRQLWQDHLSGRRDWSTRLWNVLMYQAWLGAQASATASWELAPPVPAGNS
jgi:asparagine synthase (glutamine-hydrolysing)